MAALAAATLALAISFYRCNGLESRRYVSADPKGERADDGGSCALDDYDCIAGGTSGEYSLGMVQRHLAIWANTKQELSSKMALF